jgi:hypothetical protein
MLPPKIERAQMGVGATEMWEGGLELLSSRQFFFCFVSPPSHSAALIYLPSQDPNRSRPPISPYLLRRQLRSIHGRGLVVVQARRARPEARRGHRAQALQGWQRLHQMVGRSLSLFGSDAR